MSKIVVISGSPRKDGNTEKLVTAFTNGAKSVGNEVTIFSIRDFKVNGCLGCDYCIKNEGTCIQKDDMQKINEALYEADTIVFASPSYFFGWTSQLKAIVDRLYSSIAKPFPITSSAMLLVMGGSTEMDAAGAIANYDSAIQYLKWQDKGRVIVNGVMGKNDILGNPALLEAEELGKSL